MAPLPKAPGTRARRNRASTSATIKSDPGLRAPRLPQHPRADDGGDWHAMVREWWKDIWKSPMAPEFDSSDKHGLFVLACLHDDFWSTTSPRVRAEIGAEIRLQGIRFGLSPIDRRRLQWEIERTEDAQQRGRRRRGADAPPTPSQEVADDARAVLRVMK